MVCALRCAPSSFLLSMYIDILLALASIISSYMLWQRLADKIPELTLVPDQSLAELLEENTAKFQKFFLHLFHFRSFYRERHYHEKVRRLTAKFLYRVHIGILRMDNVILRMMKRMREGVEPVLAVEPEVQVHPQINDNLIDLSRSQEQRMEQLPREEMRLQPAAQEMQRIQEVRPRRRVSPMGTPVVRTRRVQQPVIRLADEKTRLS